MIKKNYIKPITTFSSSVVAAFPLLAAAATVVGYTVAKRMLSDRSLKKDVSSKVIHGIII